MIYIVIYLMYENVWSQRGNNSYRNTATSLHYRAVANCVISFFCFFHWPCFRLEALKSSMVHEGWEWFLSAHRAT